MFASLTARAEEAKELPADATLARLVQESLAAMPELASAQHASSAQAARVLQAGAWPDPVLQLGIQNDGFKSIEVGRMETSFVSFMASQTVPWPGKTGLRESLGAVSGAQIREAMARLRLSTEAAVRRGYLDLSFVRERAELLAQRETLWQRSLEAARIKYEAGTGAQLDLLRGQVELTRLKQQRVGLLAEERATLLQLNRLRRHSADAPIATPRRIRDLPPPAAGVSHFSSARALARSPELRAARLEVSRAAKQVDLAQKSYYPDLTVGAGYMYRGALPPMWLVTVSAPVPVFAGSKQGAAETESRALGHAARSQVEALEQLVRLRSDERRVAFSALVETIGLYETTLLTQSSGAAEAALAQYQVGRASFASLLDANAGLISDEESYLRTRVDAERLLIAEDEVSLAGTPTPATAGGGASMPGAMGSSATVGSSPTRSPAAPTSAAPTASPSVGSGSGSGMSGM
ncbi:MAG: outer rane efflux protein [Polyangiaceae bacterium]|nr:outer rane efflux protein [Polyangiaceae bacterium]